MKVVPLATHLIAAAVGAGVWLAMNAEPEQPEETVVESADPIGDELRRELHRISEANASRESGGESIWPVTSEENWVELEKQDNRETDARHLQLVERSRIFERKTPGELDPLLTLALEGDDSETAQAIFLAWLRLDPQGALQQVVIRPALLEWVTDDPAVLLDVPPETMRGWVTDSNLPESFRSTMAYSAASNLASRDNLQGLRTVWEGSDADLQDSLCHWFADNWIPDDPEQAVRELFEDVPEALRNQLLGQLSRSGDPFMSFSGIAMSDEFYAAVLKRDLTGLEKVEAKFLEHLAERSSDSASGYRHPTAGAEKPERWSDDLAERTIEQSLGDWLLSDGDFPERIMAGEAGLEEARSSIVGRVPELADFPTLLDQRLFVEIFQYVPEKSIEWASHRLTPEQQADALSDGLRYADEPRALRKQAWLNAIPEDVRTARDSLRSEIKEWNWDIAEWQRLNGKPPKEEER
ncbi:hypothetical protein HAHE_16510 [Haloferula helveola]|uniref:Uncharacterized protein n=1 Tax=Haloferula helveola TaxID=490095 RepID=A0ABN6H3S8_9BACT|nr:hypothetical protein HAHE_16510 [Haloferula helveola]